MGVFFVQEVPNEDSDFPDNVSTWTWTEVCDICGDIIWEAGSFEANHKPNRETYRCCDCILDKLEQGFKNHEHAS